MDESEWTIHGYIRYYTQEQIKLGLDDLDPAQYRAQYLN
ncbi:IS3 family transposase [Aggregatibacter actinomycetemcomitans]|nr:IS3 family transposase [Aggregatibacter actinomycetemcomitans]TYB22682.1 IS3 family transposase [Aggregatibacter actinomycetemcomitans]